MKSGKTSFMSRVRKHSVEGVSVKGPSSGTEGRPVRRFRAGGGIGIACLPTSHWDLVLPYSHCGILRAVGSREGRSVDAERRNRDRSGKWDGLHDCSTGCRHGGRPLADPQPGFMILKTRDPIRACPLRVTDQCRVRCFHSRAPKEGLTSDRARRVGGTLRTTRAVD
jgi:hypothetical protein